MIDWRKELFFGNSAFVTRSQSVRNPFATSDFEFSSSSRTSTMVRGGCSGFQSLEWFDDHQWPFQSITDWWSHFSNESFKVRVEPFEKLEPFGHSNLWNHSNYSNIPTLQFEHLIRCYSILVDGESMLLDTELYHSLGSRRGSHFWKTKKNVRWSNYRW